MKKAFFKMGLVLVLVALFVASCAPAPAATVEVPVEVTRIVEGETIVEEIIVTATPVPEEMKAYRIRFRCPQLGQRYGPHPGTVPGIVDDPGRDGRRSSTGNRRLL